MSHGNLLPARAEILKLARLLGRDPAQFAYLEGAELDDLRALREQTVEVLWEADAAAMSRLAAASRVLPAAVTATIAERAFGPLLAARMAGRLEPERAVDIAAKLSTAFLADVATELDPRRSSALLALIPSWQVAAITRALVARGEHVTMGGFVGHLGDDALRAALAEMDDVTVLRVGFLLEDKGRLPHLLDLLGPGRLDALIAVAAEHELWDEVLVVAEAVPALQATLAERLTELPRTQRRALARHAAQDGGLDRLGPLGAALDPSRSPTG